MTIRRAAPADRDRLFDIWRASVRTTHTFVPEQDILAIAPEVRRYLESRETEFWVACDDGGAVVGFLGLSPTAIESLFLAPEVLRRGVGRRLVEHAKALRGKLTVDVNEQNEAACAFYRACGFVVEGRSELDDRGRPYPLLHMRVAGSR